MFKFIVILLAALMGMTLACAVVPPLASASFTVGNNTVGWYWLGVIGLIVFFYKVTD